MSAKVQIKNDSINNFGVFFSASTIFASPEWRILLTTHWVSGVSMPGTVTRKLWGL